MAHVKAKNPLPQYMSPAERRISVTNQKLLPVNAKKPSYGSKKKK